ncbi:MAG: HDOD domain-containing protein [Phycisphaerae bacterium]|nr:HDOD domain-containing protein [Phycisphaerae bacterium]
MKSVEDIVAKVDTLPPLPDTTLRLLTVLRDTTSTINDIVSVIKYDEVLTSEVLKLCNSAYLGLNRKINSLNEATVCLGVAKLMQLVMAVHANVLLGKEQQGYGLPPQALWQHSVATALGCEIIGGKVGLPNNNLVFTMGLLHDIGKVVLNEYVADQYAEIARLVDEEGRAFNEAEQMVLGYDHCEVGALLAEKWQLPVEIGECIRWHHDPTGHKGSPFIDFVYLANALSVMLGLGIGRDGLSYRANEEVLGRYHLTERDLEKFGAQVVVELAQVKEMAAETRK